MKYILSLFFVLTFVLNGVHGQQLWSSGQVIVKLQPEYEYLFQNGIPEELQELDERYGFYEATQLFNAVPNEVDQLRTDLIYQLNYTSNTSPDKLSRLMMKTGFFQYVEPRFLGELAHQPNDPNFGSQYYLQSIGAEQAWDSSTGNSSIVIGLLDAGVDTAHEDFSNQFWINTADPIDGSDNDNDGFIDNHNGWDFYTNSNHILYTTTTHGLQMAGVIAPSTNNGVGVAGIAYNCLMLPVKVTDANSSVAYGYEGIKYAADKNCKVINCSWNIKAYSEFGADMVQYATEVKGALVVAAMGNNSAEDNNYPAKFPGVLAVAAVDTVGTAVANSNHGFYTDISAPGLNVLTTNANNGYKRNSGTSISSAIVSGAAALLWSHRPQLTAYEIATYLKATSKPLYQNGQNSNYKYKLGQGMLHVGDAMKYDGSAFIELVNYQATDPVNGAIESGDTISVQVDLSNHLNASQAVVARLVSENTHSTMLQGISNWTSINKNDTVDNIGELFTIALDNSIPQNENLEYSLQIVEGGDTTTYGLSIRVNSAYQLVKTTKLETSLGNRGTFGWYLYPQQEGNGLRYQGGDQLLYEGGLMIGSSSGNVVDRIRGIRNVEQTDFTNLKSLEEINSNIPFALQGSFTDTAGSPNEIGVIVQQHAYSWTGTSTRENFVVFEYKVTSAYGQKLNGIYVGFVSDWDIEDFDKNRAEYDDFRFLAYTHSTENKGPYCGTQLLGLINRQKVYSIDNINGGGGGIDIKDNDVFSKAEKLTSMSTIRKQAGVQPGGNDVLQVMSTGPYDIEAGDTLSFQIAVLVADDLVDLQEAADTAYWLMNNRVPDGVEGVNRTQQIDLFPNPTSNEITLRSEKSLSGSIELVDVYGTLILKKDLEVTTSITLSVSKLPVGQYFIRYQGAGTVWVKPFVKN